MSDLPGMIGSVVDGAMWSRAAEPAHGEGDGHTHEGACLNCGTPLVGPHCHKCGQRAHVHRTLAAFVHDLVHGVFHFEGKTWRTLPLLAWRPGELTRRYIDGERANFVSPMGLFLFSVFLMFAVFQLVGIGPPSDLGSPTITTADNGQTLDEQLAGLREARRQIGGTSNPAAALIDGRIAALERQLEEKRDPERKVVLAENSSKTSKVTFRRTGWHTLDHAIEKWRANPSLMAYKLQSNSYKFSWLLIPLSVPFVWLIFAWRRRFGPYDHAVFVTYSLCFMSLLFVAVASLAQIPGLTATLAMATFVIPPLHIYQQLRGAYGLTRFSALWRTIVLLGFIVVVLMLFLNVLVLLGASG